MSVLTPEQLEEQLACLHCGILWVGSAEQVTNSCRDESGYPTRKPSTIEQQLAALGPAEAQRIRRRYRKLWRTAARRRGLGGVMPELKGNSKNLLAREEALRVYRAHHEQKEKA